jgi:ABC-type transport system substrate-binding protein
MSATPTATARPRARGGVARIVASRTLAFDTLAPDLTGDVSTLEVLGRTHSRLVQYGDFSRGTFSPDLASSWEQPDSLTLVLTVAPGARWHDRAPLDGAVVTADDVAGWLAAMVGRAGSANTPVVQRSHDWLSFESVRAPDARRVTVRMRQPDPFALQTLAARFSLVQAPASLELRGREQLQPEAVAGSGPFELEEYGRVVRFRAYRGGHEAPVLDGIEVHQPGAELQQLNAGQVDEAILRDRRDSGGLAPDRSGSLLLRHWYEDAPVVSTLALHAPPWNDARLRRALSAALNRVELARRLFGGRAEASAPIAPVHLEAARAGRDLSALDGYRASAADDAREGRALWEAAGGPALGPLTIDFPAIFDPRYSASSIVTGMMNEALEATVRPAVEAYTTIARKAADGRYGNGNLATWFGWGPPFVEPDPSRWFRETYGGAGAQDRGADGTSRRQLERLSTETSDARRFDLLRTIERSVLSSADGGIIHWLVQRQEIARYGYLDRPAEAHAWWPQHLDRQVSLDSSHPAFGLRAG